MPDVLELKGSRTSQCQRQSEKTRAESATLRAGAVPGINSSAGAICSTASDMAKFAIFHLNLGEFHGRRLLKANTVREMQDYAQHLAADHASDAGINLSKDRLRHGIRLDGPRLREPS